MRPGKGFEWVISNEKIKLERIWETFKGQRVDEEWYGETKSGVKRAQRIVKWKV